jgi:hypothetical protein
VLPLAELQALADAYVRDRGRRKKRARAEAKAEAKPVDPLDPLDPHGWGEAFRKARLVKARLAVERAKAAEERRRRQAQQLHKMRHQGASA